MAHNKNQVINYIAFLSVIIGFFMVMLDSTIVNITLPVMIRYFKTDMEMVSWVVNGYNLAFAVLLLTGSRIADQFGRKKVFRLGVILFTFTSLLCAMSTKIEYLIFFRVIQGLSGALLVPVSMPLVINLFPPSKNGMVIGIWGGVAGLAAASGPSIGGIIGDYLNWHWIFLINIPIGLVCVILISFLIKESYDPTASKKIDWFGILFLSVAMFTITLALIQANDKGWGSVYILSLFIISAVSFFIFFLVEKKVSDPMMPVGLLRNLHFSATMISLLVLGAALMCSVFFMAFFLTKVMEFSQLKAGLVITAYPAATIVCAALSGGLSERLGFRNFAVPGSILICISTYMMGGLDQHSGLNEILLLLAFGGGAMGLTMPPIVTASVKSSPPDKIGMASAVGNVTRSLGAILGVALLVTAVTHFAEKEIDVAKIDASEMIVSDTVFIKDVKDTLSHYLTNAKFSKDSQLPSKDEIISKFELRRDEAVKKAPSMMKPAVKKVYEQQITRMSTVYSSVKDSFLSKVSNAFSKTFKLTAFILTIGIVIAVFCEPFRKSRSKL